jgi:hypothetical protein
VVRRNSNKDGTERLLLRSVRRRRGRQQRRPRHPDHCGKHNPQQAVEARYYGYTIGRWEGDTLILDSISFVDTTWLAHGGFIHSSDMHVIEKLTRKGNEILYEVTVEDPEMLVEPWVMTPKVLRYGGAGQIQPERNHCEVYELNDIVTQIRH